MRIVFVGFLLFCLAGCNRGQNNELVRQGVLDHLTQAGLNMAGMEVAITSVKYNGNQADAAVTISAKGTNGANGMQMKYHLEQKDNKWMVVGRDSSQHGAGGLPPGGAGGADPHAGGAMGAPASGGKMPSPEDLPPATKKQ